MTVTVDMILGIAQIGLLTGIFYRMGLFTAGLNGLKERVKKLEEKAC